MSQNDYTPARLRELADKHERYAGVEKPHAFDVKTAAALRAAAATIEIERETNGATALLLQQARTALAAREPSDADVERVARAIFVCGLDATYREQARAAIAALVGGQTQGGGE